MGKYRISKAHRRILEQAAAAHSDRIELVFFSGDDFAQIKCKLTGRLLTCTFVSERYGSAHNSTEGLIELISSLMYWSSRFMQEQANTSNKLTHIKTIGD